MNKEIEGLNKNTDILTKENKELKNQLKKTEKELKDKQGFQDDFSDKSRGWAEDSDDNQETKYEDGEYHMLMKKENIATWVATQDAYSDFILEVDARQVSELFGGYGLIFRQEATYKFYRFIVSSDGNYRIDKLFEKGGEWKTIKASWIASLRGSPIKLGQEINRLKVIAHGSHIIVFANDKHLATVTDSSVKKGYVGMTVATQDKPNVHVHFANFKVTPIG